MDDRELRAPDPLLPEDVTFSLLDRDVRGRLRTLSKDNADRVGRHLVMVGRLIEDDPELAYEHAQAAVRRAGRVDVVREAAGLAAYRTGRYAEALRELRTVRRLNGSSEHVAVMADCERGLGRPERAITLAQETPADGLSTEVQVELAIVVSGARCDLGQAEAGVAALATPVVRAARGLLAVRVAQARASALEAAGRPDDARSELDAYPTHLLDEAAGRGASDDVVVYDLDEEIEALDEVEVVHDPGASDHERASGGTGPADGANAPDGTVDDSRAAGGAERPAPEASGSAPAAGEPVR